MDNIESKNIIIMKDLQGFFTEQQRVRMFNRCELLRDKVLIRLLWKTGRRISELLIMQVKDINFEKGMILFLINKKKNPYKAWKQIDKRSLKLLERYIAKGNLVDEDHLFHAGDVTRPISRQRAFQIVRRVAKLAGIKKVGEKQPHPHHFRHSFAIDVAEKLKSPGDLRKLQRHLEHNSMAVTETYLQFSNEEMSELLED